MVCKINLLLEIIKTEKNQQFVKVFTTNKPNDLIVNDII